jgi:hypothetical protein
MTLSGRTGPEIVTRDIALRLLRGGHFPIVYTRALGPLADELRSAGVPVVDEIGAIVEVPDVIHGHHNAPLAVAVARFPDVPALFVCHDFNAWHDSPPHLPSIRRYVAVDRGVVERFSAESGIAANRVTTMLDAVDLERYPRRLRAMPERPIRALAYVKHTSHVEAIAAACAARGIRLVVAGTAAGKQLDAPEDILPFYDLVFASGLGALEAMASGCAVIVCDARGLAGFVTPAAFERWRPFNFGVRTLTRRVTERALTAEIDAYDPADAAAVTTIVRRSAGLDGLVLRYVALYRECIAEAAAGRDRGGDDLALAYHLQTWGPRVGPGWPWMTERAHLLSELDVALGRPPRLLPGDDLALDENLPRSVEFVRGFGPIEDGIWTEGEDAMLVMRVEAFGQPVDLTLLVEAYVRREHPTLEVEVSVNGAATATWSFEHPHHVGWRKLRVEPPLSGIVVLEFAIHSPSSPRDLGLSADTRQLGISLKRIAFPVEGDPAAEE